MTTETIKTGATVEPIGYPGTTGAIEGFTLDGWPEVRWTDGTLTAEAPCDIRPTTED